MWFTFTTFFFWYENSREREWTSQASKLNAVQFMSHMNHNIIKTTVWNNCISATIWRNFLSLLSDHMKAPWSVIFRGKVNFNWYELLASHGKTNRTFFKSCERFSRDTNGWMEIAQQVIHVDLLQYLVPTISTLINVNPLKYAQIEAFTF